MSWVTSSDGFSILYTRAKGITTGEFTAVTPSYSTWAIYENWLNTQDIAIKYTNTLIVPIKFNSIQFSACSCNSGGLNFWTSYGERGIPCTGVKGTLKTFVDTTDIFGDHTYVQISSHNINSQTFNMNTPGSSKTNVAQFGDNPFSMQNITASSNNYPEIGPGESMYSGISFTPSNGSSSECIFRAILDHKSISYSLNARLARCLWVYNSTTKKWEPHKPVRYSQNNNWKDPED